MGVGNGPYVGPGGPNAGDCGTDPAVDKPGQAWGFKLTTGTISGSDLGPKFSSKTVGTGMTAMGGIGAVGTPFAPAAITPPASHAGFFFTRMGDDTVSGTGANQVRNLVLIGGSVVTDPDSANIFNRITSLRMRLQVPEPSAALGLIAGVGGLVALARRRRS